MSSEDEKEVFGSVSEGCPHPLHQLSRLSEAKNIQMGKSLSVCKTNEVVSPSEHEENLEKIQRLKEEVAQANAAKESAEKRCQELNKKRQVLEKSVEKNGVNKNNQN